MQSQEDMDYMSMNINPILEKMSIDTMINRPENIVSFPGSHFSAECLKVDFLIEWLEDEEKGRKLLK